MTTVTAEPKVGDLRYRLSVKNQKSTIYQTIKEAIAAFLATKSRGATISEETYEETLGSGGFVFYIGLSRYGKSSRYFKFTRKQAKEALAKAE